MIYECWIRRQTDYVEVRDVKHFTEGRTNLCEIVIAQSSDTPSLRRPLLGVITTTTLERLCGQVLFSQFILGAAEHMSIGGDFTVRSAGTSFGLMRAGLTGIAEIVERAGLGNIEEAYMSVVPALVALGKLPIDPEDTRISFREIVNATNSSISKGELEQAEWSRQWLLHVTELAADFYKDRKDWIRAGEVYLHLVEESKALSHWTDHMDEVNRRIILFCEEVYTFVATAADRTTFSNTVDLIGTCMTKIFG